MNTKEIIRSPKERLKHVNRINLLDKVGSIKLLKKTQYTTIKHIADFYCVATSKINTVVTQNRYEIFETGVRQIPYLGLKEKCCEKLSLTNSTWNKFRLENGIAKHITNLYPKQAVLLIGLILEGSPVADKLRKLALEQEDIFELSTVETPAIAVKQPLPEFVVETNKEEQYAYQMPYVAPTVELTPQKQHNDMSVSVVQQTVNMTPQIAQQQIQDELIKTQVNEENEIIVSGRELHEFLEVKARYNDWFKRMIEYGFEENQDYLALTQKRVTAQGNEITYIDHALKLDMAKEISMIQRNEKGKQARQYFIETEKRYKQVQSQPAIPMASYMIDNPIERAKMWIQEEEKRVTLETKVTEQVIVIEQKDKIIEKQVEVIKDYKEAMSQEINGKYEKAYSQSKGLPPYEVANRIKQMVINDKLSNKDSWNKLYDSYNAKYGGNIVSSKNKFAREQSLPNLSTIDFAQQNLLIISQLFETANEVFGNGKSYGNVHYL